ncbi:MAG: 50S ribosomal protein L25 [Bacillota bacterium]|nr:50S ribosomal protein L25 [Bacillota bacterium]
MNEIKLVVLERDETGSGGAKRTRNEGFVPAVLYGKDNDGQPVKIEAASLRKLISRMGSSAIFNAEYNGETKLMLLKEIQSEPISGNLIHADLLEIDANQTITTTVPLVAVGVEGLAGGVIMQQILNEISISCLPKYVPKMIEFNVAGMEPGQVVHVSDLDIDGNIEVVTAPGEVVATIAETRAVAEDEETEETAEEAAETAEEE